MARMSNAEKTRRYREKLKAARQRGMASAAIRKLSPTRVGGEVRLSQSGLLYVVNHAGIPLPYIPGYWHG